MELSDGTVTLRPWRADDAPAVHTCQDPEIQQWIPLIPRPYELEHARALVVDELGLGPYQWAIETGGRLAGSIGMQVAEGTAHIGYWCVPEARGRGVVSRARIPTAAAATR